ncbi:MAG: hypothetical protein GX657_15595 [Chloroflexi bacterium]|nr:hypothetical protein [Chloroflexota bacterium]
MAPRPNRDDGYRDDGYFVLPSWVIRATGDTSAAVAYGAIARYARMRHGACYASAQRLGDDLGWTRQRFMRQARRLLSLGLIVCDNPAAEGVTRVYRAVPRQEWEAAAGAPGPQPESAPAGHPSQRATPPAPQAAAGPVTPCDGPCGAPPPPPVTPRDAKNPIRSTTVKKQRGREGRRAAGRAPLPPPPSPAASGQPAAHRAHSAAAPTPQPAGRPGSPAEEPPLPPAAARRPPAVQTYWRVTGRLPHPVLDEAVCAVIRPGTAPERLRPYFTDWCRRGYNPDNMAWLLEWFADGAIPRPRARAAPNSDPPASAAEFARSGRLQARLQGQEAAHG